VDLEAVDLEAVDWEAVDWEGQAAGLQAFPEAHVFQPTSLPIV